MTGVRVQALSLHQPWASLVALGVKKIETRSWSTRYRGPLLIHAAKQPIRDTAKGRAPVGEYRPRLFGRTGVALEGPGLPPFRSTPRLEGYIVPFGAVVASCVLTDCLPIVEDGLTGLYDADTTEWPKGDWGAVTVNDKEHSRDDVDVWRPARFLAREEEIEGWIRERTFYDERPYGDYTAGRFAWLLGDVKPTTERCPRCWGSRLGEQIGPTYEMVIANRLPQHVPCAVCDGEGVCEPVPMRGRQRLFEPTW
jgi:ASCH domain